MQFIDENIYKEAEKLLVEVMNFINTNSFDKIIFFSDFMRIGCYNGIKRTCEITAKL